RLVQGRVELVEQAERRGLHQVEREEERDRGQGPLPAREERDALEPRAGRLRDDLYPALEDVVRLDEVDGGAAAPEQRVERVLEVLAYLREGDLELPLRGLVDLVDRGDELGLRLAQVVALRPQEVVALLELRVLLDGDEVDGPHAAHLLAQGVDLRLDRVPVGGLERGEVGLARALGALPPRAPDDRLGVLVLVQVERPYPRRLVVGVP